MNTQENPREGIRMITRSNGVPYSIRDDRSRYFFPEEWIRFYDSINIPKQPLFDCLINTGARIEEALHIREKDFDWNRNTLKLVVTKAKATKGEKKGRPRTFVISSQFARRMRKYIKSNNLNPDERLFKITKQAAYQMLRRVLVKAKIEDPWNFGLHNIRKTHGNYLKALDVSAEEICLRLGHDFNTYLKHYGSATIFDRRDKMLMIKILGDVYGFK